MVYFAEGVGRFYMSQDACMALGIIAREFPTPMAAGRGYNSALQSLTGPNGSRNHGTLNYSSGMVQSCVPPVPNSCISPHVQPMGVQQQQVQGGVQHAHGEVGAREKEPLLQDLRGLEEKVREGVVLVDNNVQVQFQASDPRRGLSPEAATGAGVGAVVEGQHAGAKAGVVTGGPSGGATVPNQGF